MPEPLVSPPRHARRLENLSARLVSFVFLSTALTAAAVGWLAVESTRASLVRSLEQSLPVILVHAATGVERVLAAAQADLERAAAAWPARCPFGAACPADPVALGRELERQRRAGSLEGLALLDASGRWLAVSSGVPGRPGARIEAAAPGAHGAAVVPAAGRDELDVVVVQPLPDGRRLLGWPERRALAAELASQPLRPQAALFLVDARGRVVGRAASSPGRERIPEAALDARGAVADYRLADGQRSLAASRALAGGLRLVIEEPWRGVFAPVSQLVAQLFAVDLAILLAAGLLAHRIARTLARPIRALSEGVQRICAGERAVQIPEPAGSDEIALLTRTMNHMIRRLGESREEIEAANRELKRRNEELQGANEVLEQLSITDGLTKLHNHRFFQDFLTREIKRVRRTGEALSMLLVDIDDFKRLNDRLGHAAGDELLKAIARSLNAAIRESDFLARYGGEEFVVLAANTDLSGAIHLAEKVRTEVAESSFIVDETMQVLKVTVSVGVAQYRGDRKDFFQAADRALYRAKAEGRNCVVAEDPEPRAEDAGRSPSA
jgi:diguanylate cyclase (GGDEF)-like protein